jgi:heptosyltransferase-2
MHEDQSNKQKTSKTILVIGPAWVGDMVMAQSLFKTIQKNHPGTLIDVLAPAWTYPLLRLMPEVREGILMPLGHGALGLGVRYRLAQSLKTCHYDQAIVLSNTWKSALVPFFAHIPKRTGWCGEMRWGLLNDLRSLDKTAFPLMIDRYAALGYDKNRTPSNAPWPELCVTPEEVQATLAHFSLEKMPLRPILILCPGAEGGQAKRWPEDRFAVLANQKIKEGWQVWILGSPKDVPIAADVEGGIHKQYLGQCINLTGKTTLDQAIHLLASAVQVVANDSGLMHVAAALQVPLVGIFGPSDANHTPPLSKNAKAVSIDLSCRPCFKRSCPLKHHQCMQGLSPERVAAAFYSPGMLGESSCK